MRAAVVHAAALARMLAIHARGWGAGSARQLHRMSDDIDRLREEVGRLREELPIKDARMAVT